MTTGDQERTGHLEPPTVLLVIDALYKNGAVNVSLELTRRWAAVGGRLAVVQEVRDGEEAAVPPEVRLERLSSGSGRLRGELGGVIRRLVRLASDADVVVGGSEIGVGLPLAYLAARAARKPFVIAVHADLDAALEEWMAPRTHRLYHWLHRHADGAISVSPGLVPALVAHGVEPARIRVVRNGIDTASVRAAAAQSADHQSADYQPAEVPTVVATGRLAHQKGIDILLRAHATVRPAYPHRVLLLNDGPERESLQALARELGVEDTVYFEGAVPRPLPAVARAELFCLPSRHEGLPLALLEAVALGAPCIAADCSEGVRTALDDGRVGDLVPVDDVEALTAALASYLADPAPLRAKAARGPEYAQGFDSSVMARQWLEALRELVSASR